MNPSERIHSEAKNPDKVTVLSNSIQKNFKNKQTALLNMAKTQSQRLI